jgi:hypothetical protein
MGFKFGGDVVKPIIGWINVLFICVRITQHGCSSLKGGGGERAGTDYFALKLNASSQGVINCNCSG